MNNTKSTFKQVLEIIMGALLMGLLWRVRGEHGWGSSWGLLNAGFIFTMFVVFIKGSRKKLDLGWIGLTALSFMITTPGWGTLLNQITGVLHVADEDYPVTVFTSIPAAVFLMVCLGFGLAAIFGIMLGRGFSEKQWKIKDFVILIAVFLITDLIVNLFISPFILKLVQPEAVDLFQKGLEIKGNDLAPYSAYLENFKDLSYAKKIVGGRNYFQSIETISSAISAVVSILVTNFVIKDKVAAKVGTVTCGAFAFAITVSDLFFYFGHGGYHMLNNSYLPEFFSSWGCWEYFTGFVAGAVITAFIVKLKPQKDVEEIAFNGIKQKPKTILTFILSTLFMVGVNIVRPILVRYEDTGVTVPAVILSVLFALVFIIILVKRYGINSSKKPMYIYSRLILIFFVTYIIAVYLAVGSSDCTHLWGNYAFQHLCAVISAVVINIWLYIDILTLRAKRKKENKKFS